MNDETTTDFRCEGCGRACIDIIAESTDTDRIVMPW
jgi:uncharacterized cysteine cluster protein YcgN (CxxCxxCC family)